ncbi:MAG TPA: group I intron-associated PD-(D/E)XK endonuclease [Candidatus Sulfotelmatobacter sp.]|nr:group I intron-associated PD-(D/E)XK endonuclease [Candidatus Sulfotelmatobacter sp.]
MMEFIGDLMAVADGDGKERGRKRLGARGDESKGQGDGDECTGPSARKGRGPQDDNAAGSNNPKVARKRLPPKMMGELGELDFLRKAMGMGMIVSKPWGDSYRYDFVCDTGGKLWRVQVRATEYRMGARGYAVHASVYVGKKIVGLTKKDIDVIVAYISTRDIWYVVPVRAFVPRKNLWFYPDGSKKGAMFEKYREAWWVITGKR